MPRSLSRDRLVALLDASAGRRVAVVGDAMLDVYLRGDVDRISPEAPVPVVRVRDRRYALGGAGNVAQNVCAVGARCDLVATVGEDAGGRQLRDMLAGISANARLAGDDRRGRRRRRRASSLDRSRSFASTRRRTTITATRTSSDCSPPCAASVARADALVLEDYNKGVLVPRVIEAAMQAAQARGIPIVVDPKYRNFFLYRGATIFKPNRRELEAALGADVDLEHPTALPATFDRLGVGHLLLTLGERGMVLLSSNGVIKQVPTVAREVYDVVGAGDTVTAYLALVLAAGGTPTEAAIIANFAAGVEVGKPGAATVSPEEVLEAYDAFMVS